MGVITRYGGPILYLIVMAFVLLAVLVFADSGSRWHQQFSFFKKKTGTHVQPVDVASETQKSSTVEDALRVLKISKTYGSNTVVDDVSIGVDINTIFALLGPNGAGKTTTFNIIRELYASCPTNGPAKPSFARW